MISQAKKIIITTNIKSTGKREFLMPRTKKAAAAAEKEETKVTKAAEKATKAAEKVAEKVEEKKAPAKKAAPKKPVEAPAEAPAEAKVDFFVEFGGAQVSVEKVVADVKATYGKDAKEFAVYLKPEESKAYFVADGESGEMDVFFC